MNQNQRTRLLLGNQRRSDDGFAEGGCGGKDAFVMLTQNIEGDLLFRMISRKTGVEMSATPLWEVFLAATLGSAVIEFLTSYILEKRFHATWWDYSHLPLNINGRVCLIYSLFWGLLGIAWVKLMIPFLNFCFTHISIPFDKVLLWAFIIFFIFDAALSASAAVRMNRRNDGIAPKNQFEEFLDSHYNDEKMHEIYANSKSVEES